MTFLHIPDHGLAPRALGERRRDHATAATISAALNEASSAPGRQAAARTLARERIDLAIALRILGAPRQRRP